jgi:hypothetical protein
MKTKVMMKIATKARRRYEEEEEECKKGEEKKMVRDPVLYE